MSHAWQTTRGVFRNGATWLRVVLLALLGMPGLATQAVIVADTEGFAACYWGRGPVTLQPGSGLGPLELMSRGAAPAEDPEAPEGWNETEWLALVNWNRRSTNDDLSVTGRVAGVSGRWRNSSMTGFHGGGSSAQADGPAPRQPWDTGPAPGAPGPREGGGGGPMLFPEAPRVDPLLASEGGARPVPEPGMWVAGLILLLPALAARRRRAPNR